MIPTYYDNQWQDKYIWDAEEQDIFRENQTQGTIEPIYFLSIQHYDSYLYTINQNTFPVLNRGRWIPMVKEDLLQSADGKTKGMNSMKACAKEASQAYLGLNERCVSICPYRGSYRVAVINPDKTVRIIDEVSPPITKENAIQLAKIYAKTFEMKVIINE